MSDFWYNVRIGWLVKLMYADFLRRGGEVYHIGKMDQFQYELWGYGKYLA